MARGRAALLVAGLAFAAAWPERPPPWRSCRTPETRDTRGALLTVACEKPTGIALEGATRLVFELPLDLNRADATALEALPGIGPGRAGAIVRARRERPFCRIDELDRVPGLGVATVARLASLVAVGAAPGCAGG